VAILDVQGINICLVRIWKLNEIRTKRGKILKFELDLVKNTIGSKIGKNLKLEK